MTNRRKNQKTDTGAALSPLFQSVSDSSSSDSSSDTDPDSRSSEARLAFAILLSTALLIWGLVILAL
jgi:hypothetical protein